MAGENISILKSLNSCGFAGCKVLLQIKFLKQDVVYIIFIDATQWLGTIRNPDLNECTSISAVPAYIKYIRSQAHYKALGNVTCYLYIVVFGKYE